MIKTIIFDAGSVLFKTDFKKIDKVIKKKYNTTILIHSSGNKEAREEYLRESEGKGSLKKVFILLGAKKKIIPSLIKDYKRLYIEHKKINKNLLKFIKKLKKDYEVVCLTDTHKLHYDANVSINFFRDFKKVFASHILKVNKKNLRAFKNVLKQLGKEPEECLFVDDKPKNIKNARRVGIKAILYQDFPKISKLKKEIYKHLK